MSINTSHGSNSVASDTTKHLRGGGTEQDRVALSFSNSGIHTVNLTEDDVTALPNGVTTDRGSVVGISQTTGNSSLHVQESNFVATPTGNTDQFVDLTVNNGAVALTDGVTTHATDNVGDTITTTLTLNLFEPEGSHTIQFMLSDSSEVVNSAGQILSESTGSTPLTITPGEKIDWTSVIAPFGNLSSLMLQSLRSELAAAVDPNYLSWQDVAFASGGVNNGVATFSSVLNHLVAAGHMC